MSCTKILVLLACVVAMAWVTSAATMCYMLYAPVCAVRSDGQQVTFGNMCFFQSAAQSDPGLRVLRSGACGSLATE